MNGQKNFMQLNPDECGRVYKHIEENGLRHMSIADMLAEKEYFGAALSHLVLGTEELIKSLALLLESKEFALRNIKGVNRLFSQHGARHHLMRDFFSVWLFVRPFLNEIHRKGGSFVLSAYDRKGRVIDGFLFHSIMKVATGMQRAQQNFDWWQRADELKQKGFYVDYQDRLLCPTVIGRQEFVVGARHVRRFLRDYRSFVLLLENATARQVSEYRELFVESELPELIRQMIERKNGVRE